MWRNVSMLVMMVFIIISMFVDDVGASAAAVKKWVKSKIGKAPKGSKGDEGPNPWDTKIAEMTEAAAEQEKTLEDMKAWYKAKWAQEHSIYGDDFELFYAQYSPKTIKLQKELASKHVPVQQHEGGKKKSLVEWSALEKIDLEDAGRLRKPKYDLQQMIDEYDRHFLKEQKAGMDMKTFKATYPPSTDAERQAIKFPEKEKVAVAGVNPRKG